MVYSSAINYREVGNYFGVCGQGRREILHALGSRSRARARERASVRCDEIYEPIKNLRLMSFGTQKFL